MADIDRIETEIEPKKREVSPLSRQVSSVLSGLTSDLTLCWQVEALNADAEAMYQATRKITSDLMAYFQVGDFALVVCTKFSTEVVSLTSL